MAFVSPQASLLRQGFTKPIVQALFWASCLLSVVSFYTTQQGMQLYLAVWFSIIAALGVQLSLVMVAWLIGFTRQGKTLLIVVYVVTGLISIAFSYVSLYTWFSARERPVLMQRALYDELTEAAARTGQLLSQAVQNGQRYVTALQEMTAAEKAHGHISRARDPDPYLDRIRAAVAKEAQSFSESYREGQGTGIRYTAFERYTKLTQETVTAIEAARQALDAHRAGMKPGAATEEQLRAFHAVYDPIPWNSVRELLNRPNLEPPALPAYSRFVEQSGSGQEDLLRAFEELIAAPTSRHWFSLALATFIDLIVFLLAYSAGPYFYGDAGERWMAAGAALDASDHQLFVAGLLRKMHPGHQGMPRVRALDLTPGEQQLCLLLVNKELATTRLEDEGLTYFFDPRIHEKMLESLAERGVPFRAAQRAAAGA